MTTEIAIAGRKLRSLRYRSLARIVVFRRRRVGSASPVKCDWACVGDGSSTDDVEMRWVGIGRDCRGEAMMSRQDAVAVKGNKNESRVSPGEEFGVA